MKNHPRALMTVLKKKCFFQILCHNNKKKNQKRIRNERVSLKNLKKQPSYEKDHEFQGYLSLFIERVRRRSAWGIENGFLKMPKSVIDA